MTEELHPDIQRLMDDLQVLAAGHKNTDPTTSGIERLREAIRSLQRETAAHVRGVMLLAVERFRAEKAEARVAELEMALRDARTNLTAEGHDESLRIFWALNDINCAIN